jgi:hypothetical protein
MESGLKGQFSVLEFLSPWHFLANPLSGENQCPVSIPSNNRPPGKWHNFEVPLLAFCSGYCTCRRFVLYCTLFAAISRQGK